MRVFGLTGGIATGKSTVSSMFRDAGLPIIDADLLAREVVEPGTPALAEIAARFPGVIGADGRLDRKKLGARIFNDAAERAALGAITHPRIRDLALERTTALAQTGAPIAIYDAPLLIENRLHEGMNGVILVVCPEAVQLERLRTRDGLTDEQARARVASQMPLPQKRAHATWVIDNGGSLAQTRAQVEQVISQLR
jgi:dephospho-CoA kinase